MLLLLVLVLLLVLLVQAKQGANGVRWEIQKGGESEFLLLVLGLFSRLLFVGVYCTSRRVDAGNVEMVGNFEEDCALNGDLLRLPSSQIFLRIWEAV